MYPVTSLPLDRARDTADERKVMPSETTETPQETAEAIGMLVDLTEPESVLLETLLAVDQCLHETHKVIRDVIVLFAVGKTLPDEGEGA